MFYDFLQPSKNVMTSSFHVLSILHSQPYYNFIIYNISWRSIIK